MIDVIRSQIAPLVVAVSLIALLSSCSSTEPNQGPLADVPGSDVDGVATPDSCAPECVDKQCGPDGCGGTCGTCPSGTNCNQDGYCRSDECGATALTVSGEIETDLGALPFDSVELTVVHKQDIDPFEDRCISEIWAEFRNGSGCYLSIRASETVESTGALEIRSVALSADSQCPGFADDMEGQYESEPNAIVGSIDPGITKVPDANAASSCFGATMRIDLSGTLSRIEPTLAANLSVSSASLAITGDVTSTGDSGVGCPCMWTCEERACGDDGCGRTCGTCGCGQECVEGSCVTNMCVGSECGPDGCGGSCGDCEDGWTCSAGQCVCASTTDDDCDGVDDDCNGLTDEDYVEALTQCGIGACKGFGEKTCVSGVESDSCIPSTPIGDELVCDGIDDDCDGETDEDYVPTPIACGIGPCASVGLVECVNGVEKEACEPGVPLDVDLPDTLGLDDDCDGIDGQWSLAVLVDGSDPQAFDDGNESGDVTHPFLTVTAAINFAVAQAKPHVYVSQGTYVEQVALRAGTSIFGGYDAASDWTRDIDGHPTLLQWNEASDGHVIAVLAEALHSATTIDGFRIEAGSNPTVGGSSYGIYLFHTSQDLVISNNRIVAGNGGDGMDGAQGNDGLAGENGENGNTGCEYDGCMLCSCMSCSQPPVGGGGQGYCSNPGGAGGLGGEHEENGNMGESAPNGANGGGYGALSLNGQSGDGGAEGAAGKDGRGGFANGYIDDSGFWSAYDGEDGTNGTKGWGGGGGGGGGGDEGSFLGNNCYTYGGSGGGGGAGGCSGTRGTKGTGGGGSFGLFVVDGDATLVANEIRRGHGGRGGSGGTGGDGGKGGAHGIGGLADPGDNAGSGGDGGNGGDGGSGGSGGGGTGGSSYGIFVVGQSSLACSLATFTQEGDAGAGGVGGNGNIESQGADGTSGNINIASLTCQP